MQDLVYHSNFQFEESYWWFTAREHIILSLMQQYCPLQKSDVLLDVGCGTGGFLRRFDTMYTAVGLDMSPIAIEYCRKRGLNNLVQGTLADFPKEKWNVRAITMFDVIEHIPADAEVVRQAFEILEPGGYLIASVPAYQSLWSTHDEIHMHIRRYTRKNFGELLRSSGFSLLKSTYFNTFLFLPALLDRIKNRHKKYESEADAIPPVSPLINTTLDSIFRSEAAFLKHVSFPFGLSIFVVAQKPR